MSEENDRPIPGVESMMPLPDGTIAVIADLDNAGHGLALVRRLEGDSCTAWDPERPSQCHLLGRDDDGWCELTRPPTHPAYGAALFNLFEQAGHNGILKF